MSEIELRDAIQSLPTMAHLIDDMVDTDEETMRKAYALLGVFFNEEGELILSKTVFAVARYMSRNNNETPQLARENTVVAMTWRGDNPFNAEEIAATLFHYDIEVDKRDIQKCLNTFVRKGAMVKLPTGYFQMKLS